MKLILQKKYKNSLDYISKEVTDVIRVWFNINIESIVSYFTKLNGSFDFRFVGLLCIIQKPHVNRRDSSSFRPHAKRGVLMNPAYLGNFNLPNNLSNWIISLKAVSHGILCRFFFVPLPLKNKLISW